MVKALPLLCLTLACSAAHAQTLRWFSESTATPDSGAGSGFAMSQLDARFPWESSGNKTERFKSEVHLQYTQYEWDGVDALGDNYLWLAVPLQYRQRRGTQTEFILKAEPGLMMGGITLSKDALFMNWEASGRYYLRGDSFVQLGMTVSRELGDGKVYPLVAVAWKPTAYTEVLAGYPRSHVHTWWSDALHTYAHIQPAGGMWYEEVGDEGIGTRVKYRNWQVGAGAKVHWRGPAWVAVEVGQMMERRISALDGSGARVTAKPADSLYWQLGLELRY